MERIEYCNIVDKSEWPRGPWDNEPDKIQWQDSGTSLPCLIVRGPSGALCGYVGLSASHPLFEKDYNECDVRVHGGLTFADHCQPGAEEDSICHIPSPGEPDHVWWLGFDCAHSGDKTPACEKYSIFTHGTYRNIQYVTDECRNLAKQLKEMMN